MDFDYPLHLFYVVVYVLSFTNHTGSVGHFVYLYQLINKLTWCMYVFPTWLCEYVCIVCCDEDMHNYVSDVHIITDHMISSSFRQHKYWVIDMTQW